MFGDFYLKSENQGKKEECFSNFLEHKGFNGYN